MKKPIAISEDVLKVVHNEMAEQSRMILPSLPGDGWIVSPEKQTAKGFKFMAAQWDSGKVVGWATGKLLKENGITAISIGISSPDMPKNTTHQAASVDQ